MKKKTMNEFLAFGGIIKDKDVRDFDLHTVNKVLGAGVPIPPVYRPDYSSLPVYHQGKQPACGAHTGTALKLVQELKTNPDFSPRYLWGEIKKIDNFPISSGTDINSIFNALRANTPTIKSIQLVCGAMAITNFLYLGMAPESFHPHQ